MLKFWARLSSVLPLALAPRGWELAGRRAPGLPADTWLWVSVARQVSALHPSPGDALVSAHHGGTSGLWEVGSPRLREFGTQLKDASAPYVCLSE